MSVTRSVTTKRSDGSSFTHTAVFVRYEVVADGIIAVEGMCCSDDKTRSRHTLPFDVAGRTQADILAEINDHLDRIAQGHAARQVARDFLETLVPVAAPPPALAAPQPLTPNPGSGGAN